MNKTACMIMKIIGASLALAALVCLVIGGWHDLTVGCKGMKACRKKSAAEFEDYDDEDLYI